MPKVIDHDQRRRDIIDVTWKLIVEGGLEAATMREIAKEAGFANGALKHYFPSKDEIIQSTFDRALEMMGDRVGQAVGDRVGIDALRAACWATAPLSPEAVTASRVLLSFWERAVSNETLRATYLRHIVSWREGLAETITAGRERGEITTQTSDRQLIDEIVLMNVGSTVMGLLAPDMATADRLEAQLEAFFARLAR